MNRFLLITLLALGTCSAQASSVAAQNLCASISYDTDKLTCYESIADGYFDDGAVAVCADLSFSADKQACLSAIKGHGYSQGAINVCQSLSFSTDRTDCLSKIADKTYATYESDACAAMSFSSDKLDCLSRLGHAAPPAPAPYPYPYPYPQQPQPPVIIIQPYQPVPAPAPTYHPAPVPAPAPAPLPIPPQQPIANSKSPCYVKQIHGWKARDRFYTSAFDLAEHLNTCVIAGITGQPFSSRVYTKSGRLGAKSDQGVSDQQAALLANMYGAGPCQRYTCDQSDK